MYTDYVVCSKWVVHVASVHVGRHHSKRHLQMESGASKEARQRNAERQQYEGRIFQLKSLMAEPKKQVRGDDTNQAA